RIRARVGPAIPFKVADNPEVLKEGAAIDDFMKPDRVVVGIEDETVGEAFKQLYDPFVRNGHPIYLMDVPSAEMVKYCANNFLATKISFINEMANLCEAYGADINRVREGMCSDKRIGNAFLYPGLGYGGSCFPKDTLALVRQATEFNAPTRLIEAVVDVNAQRKKRMADKIIAAFGGVAGKTVAVLGVTFKPNTDDMRDSPSLDIIPALQAAGARVTAFDPEGMHEAGKLLTGVTWARGTYEAMTGADGVVILTEWNQFRALDFARMKSILRRPLLVDLRNIYTPREVADAGFEYHSVGRLPLSQP
ncbi:MAG: UDP-glucose dehydrogenase family protein, partial [Alphaproteobacteria bacterium]